MNDYKDLVNKLKNNYPLSTERDAADAIEQLVKERDAAIDCIYAIEDDLDRGNDNDWAREHIKEWRGVQEVEHEAD